MAIQVLDAGVVKLTTSATDVSNHVESCVFSVNNQSVQTRTLGNTWGTSLPTNQKTWSVKLAIYNDFSTSDGPVFDILKNCLSSQGALYIEAKATTAVQGAANPTLSGNASLDGDYDLFTLNANPTAPLINLTLKGNGTLTIATSST